MAGCMSREEPSSFHTLLANIARWTHFVCSLGTIVLGIIAMCARDVSLSVDGNGFAKDDTNKDSWRMAFFTFVPSVFIDIWTPVLMGTISLGCHFPSFRWKSISGDFTHSFIWLFIMAMFGNLGYAGGVGVIIGSLTLFATLMNLIAAFVHDGPPYLDMTTIIEKRKQRKAAKKGVNSVVNKHSRSLDENDLERQKGYVQNEPQSPAPAKET